MKKRTWAKEVHPLADASKPCGTIHFIHFQDKKEHTFGFANNKMSESSLAWFDSSAPSIGESQAWIKSVIRDIYKKADKVIEHVGDYQQK